MALCVDVVSWNVENKERYTSSEERRDYFGPIFGAHWGFCRIWFTTMYTAIFRIGFVRQRPWIISGIQEHELKFNATKEIERWYSIFQIIEK